jgi:hypothetical protein
MNYPPTPDGNFSLSVSATIQCSDSITGLSAVVVTVGCSPGDSDMFSESLSIGNNVTEFSGQAVLDTAPGLPYFVTFVATNGAGMVTTITVPVPPVAPLPVGVEVSRFGHEDVVGLHRDFDNSTTAAWTRPYWDPAPVSPLAP